MQHNDLHPEKVKYGNWEKPYLDRLASEGKTFAERKRKFDQRIIQAPLHKKELRKEIDCLCQEYEQPGKELAKHLMNENQHIVVFRQRLAGHLLDEADEMSKRRTARGVLRYFEGEQAFQYLHYLVARQKDKKWLKKLKEGDFLSSHNLNIKLSHAQIAILYHLEGWSITKNNADEIACCYGQTSGQKLESTYRDLTSSLTRTARGKRRESDYETILPLLSSEARPKGEKELRDVIDNTKK